MVGNELAATSSSSGGFNPSTLIIILIVIVAFYLLMIRPQQRRRQQQAQKQDTVRPGARVRTTAGMYATVVDVDGDDVVLEVAPGVEVRYMKRAVMDVVSPADDETPADETDTGYDAVSDDETEAGYDAASDEPTDAPAGSVNGDSEQTAYEQATGTKKD
jgi:preprotein translocase subunit YajC